MKSLVSLFARLGLPVLALAGLASCERPEAVKPPPHLLSRPEMVSFLVQTHLLEARIENSRLTPDSARALFNSQLRDVLWRHNVTDADSAFQRSYRYYATHDKDLQEIYTEVIDSLTVRNQQLGGSAIVHPY